MDHEKKTLKGRLSPYTKYYSDDYLSEFYGSEMKRAPKHWFNGYIAKNKTCIDGSLEITERYKEKYNAILAECLEIIEEKLGQGTVEQ